MDEMLRDLRMLALAANTLRTLSVLRKVIVGLMVAFTALRAVHGGRFYSGSDVLFYALKKPLGIGIMGDWRWPGDA